MKRICVVICIATTCVSLSYTQSRSQLNPKTGLAILRLADERRVNDEIRYYGHSYGVEGIVVESWFHLMTGMHYQRIALAGTEISRPFISRANFHQLHVPVRIGVSLPATAGQFALRPYVGGHVNVVFAVDDNPGGLTLDRVTGFNPGWQFGMQAMARPLTFDLQAVFSARTFLEAREDARFRGLIMLIGFLF